MGESVAEATITKWLKGVGDRIERDEPLFEITTDKVDSEVTSTHAGFVAALVVPPGKTVEVGAVVAYLETEAADLAASGLRADAPLALASLELGGGAPAVAAAPAAVVTAPAAAPTAKAAPVDPSKASAEELRAQRSTPLVRRIAQEHGIADLGAVAGTGLSGRVTKRDILGFIEAGAAAPASGLRADGPLAAPSSQLGASAPAAPAASPVITGTSRVIPSLPPVEVGARDRVEAMSPQRLAIARHMVASRATSPHAHTVHEVDFHQVSKVRGALKAEYEERGVKLTFTAFMVKAVGQALAELPLVNASIEGDSIVYRGAINVGVAVALEDSLIVPVVRDVDELSLLGVARAIQDLSDRARNKKLKPDEIRGGTFTLSNHGIFGAEFGVPIINQPQVAIVSTGAIKKRVVVDERTDAIMIRPTSIFCLSFDHRVIDGGTADRFMQRVRQLLEGWTI
jgi:2-oxoglutarate dehydrogenase E2 component (dihydrolipoamide succinyltransferase)